MYTKAQIFNLALGALLLERRTTNADTDTASEVKTLRTYWDGAWSNVLEDLDLDSTSTVKTLELVTANPNDLWGYAYKYPSDCAFFRRIQNGSLKDKRSNQIARRIAIHEGQKVIFTNQEDAICEYISTGVLVGHLSASAGIALAHKLAWLASALVTGKGSAKLADSLQAKYIQFKAEAQEKDRLENFNFEDPEDTSEFVEERLS